MSDVREDGEAPDVDSMGDDDFRKFMSEQGSDAPSEEDVKSEPKKPEPAPSDDDEGDEGDEPEPKAGEKQETVKYNRYHRERERRKAAEAERQALSERYERMESRFHQMLEANNRPQQQERPQEPSYDEQRAELLKSGDFLGVQELDAAQIRAFQQRERERDEFGQRNQMVQNAVREVQSRTFNDFDQARRSDASIDDAYAFLCQSSIQEDMAINGINEVQAAQRLQQRELTFYAQLLDQGRRPSDVIMQMAKQRGWQKQAEKPDATALQAEMDKVNAAKDAAKSLSTAGSEARTGRLTVKDIDAMSDAEFAAFKKKHGENAMRQVDWAA